MNTTALPLNVFDATALFRPVLTPEINTALDLFGATVGNAAVAVAPAKPEPVQSMTDAPTNRELAVKEGRWIPADCQRERRTVNGVVFYGQNGAKFYAIGYRGKATKRDFYFSYRQETAMMNAMIDFHADLDARASRKAAASAERKAFDARASYKIGDIIYSSWGFDQTNVDFYIVEAVSAKFLTLREIGSKGETTTGSMSGTCVADPESKTGDAFKAGASPDGVCLRKSHGRGSKWDGKPKYWSSYA